MSQREESEPIKKRSRSIEAALAAKDAENAENAKKAKKPKKPKKPTKAKNHQSQRDKRARGKNKVLTETNNRMSEENKVLREMIQELNSRVLDQQSILHEYKTNESLSVKLLEKRIENLTCQVEQLEKNLATEVRMHQRDLDTTEKMTCVIEAVQGDNKQLQDQYNRLKAKKDELQKLVKDLQQLVATLVKEQDKSHVGTRATDPTPGPVESKGDPDPKTSQPKKAAEEKMNIPNTLYRAAKQIDYWSNKMGHSNDSQCKLLSLQEGFLTDGKGNLNLKRLKATFQPFERTIPLWLAAHGFDRVLRGLFQLAKTHEEKKAFEGRTKGGRHGSLFAESSNGVQLILQHLSGQREEGNDRCFESALAFFVTETNVDIKTSLLQSDGPCRQVYWALCQRYKDVFKWPEDMQPPDGDEGDDDEVV